MHVCFIISVTIILQNRVQHNLWDLGYFPLGLYHIQVWAKSFAQYLLSSLIVTLRNDNIWG